MARHLKIPAHTAKIGRYRIGVFAASDTDTRIITMNYRPSDRLMQMVYIWHDNFKDAAVQVSLQQFLDDMFEDVDKDEL